MPHRLHMENEQNSIMVGDKEHDVLGAKKLRNTVYILTDMEPVKNWKKAAVLYCGKHGGSGDSCQA